MKHIVIIGAGISGLATAWWTHKKYPHAHITIIEKENHVGGCIHATQHEHVHFDMGPKGFLIQGDGRFTLKLIKELGIHQHVVFNSPSAKTRFVYYKEKMHKISLKTLISNGLLSSCIKDLCASRYTHDSSVLEFLQRHCSPKLIHHILNPAVLATRAGHSHLLSTQVTFPELFHQEAQKGSLLFRFLKQALTRKNSPGTFASLSPNFHLLIEALKAQLPVTWMLSSPVSAIHNSEHSVHITVGDQTLSADLLLYTGSIATLSSLWENPNLIPLSKKIIPLYLSAMSLAWTKQQPKLPKGYGVLFADEPPLLGIAFNSQMFPTSQPTSLSLMMDGIWHEETAYASSLAAITKYLNISTPPDAYALFSPPEGLPQHRVGFLNIWNRVKHSLPPNIKLLGQHIVGPGVNRCVAEAFRTVVSL